MPPPKDPTSGFAAAAKVLFDSAQRAGAVQPLEQSTKQYAHQLKKIQSQSKKRGGSLGGVSYKVAEFLAAQRAPAPQPPPRTGVPLERSIAKKVPLINIPSLARVAAPGKPVAPAPPDVKSEVQQAPPLVPSLSIFPTPSAQPAESVPHVHSSPPAAEEVAQSAAAVAPHAEEVLVMEDKPLFEVRQPTSAPPLSAAVVQPVGAAQVAAAAEPEPRRAKRAKPLVRVPIASDTTVTNPDEPVEAQASPTATPPAPAFSVDAWEQQREKELERLQKKQEEEEQVRLALLREEEHKTLGKEWVALRTCTESFEAELSPGGKLLRDLYYAKSGDAALASFQKMVDAGPKAVALLPAAISSVSHHIREHNPAEQTRLKRSFIELAEKAKLSDPLRRKVLMMVTGGGEFLGAYDGLTPAERQRLDRSVVLKAVRVLLLEGRWEDSLALAKESRGNFSSSSSDSVDLVLLRTCRTLEEGPRKEVVSYATRSLTEQGRLGKVAKLLIARTETGVYRRTLLKQIAASSDVDENVYAELIVRSGKDQTEVLLAEMRNRGLNVEDPVVLGAVTIKKMEDDNPAEVFKEIEQQAAKIGVRPIHVVVATAVARLHPTEDVLRQAVAVVMALPAVSRGVGLRKLLPLLYQHGLIEDIIEVADKTGESISVADLVVKATAFVNEALIKVGRTPLNNLRATDIGAAHVAGAEAATAAGAPGRTRERTSVVVSDLSGLTERMLLYAKERQWSKALDTVLGLPASIEADPSAVTLVYNCALSAAVERPETVKQVYALMQSRGVKTNPTTTNTVLSSLGKSTSWEEALSFFDSTPLAKRDNNTYLVYFALLGKQGLWKDAMEGYDAMRQAVPKPPATMFSLILNTVSPHDWQATLCVFGDMLKVHGASVKDSVVSQVIRSLEQHDKPAEIAKLERELAKRKKKKK